MEQPGNINSFKLFSKLRLSDIYLKISKPVVVADNLRTPENMGSVLRLAANIGAEKVLFVKRSDELPRNWKIKKTASGADEKISWQFVTFEELKEHIPVDYQIIAIETSDTAVNLYETSLPEKCAFVIGHEVYGIGEKLLAMAGKTVYIPIPGVISSLNVTHALWIVLFEWFRQRITPH